MASEKVTQLMEEVKNMTVLELSELVKALKKNLELVLLHQWQWLHQ